MKTLVVAPGRVNNAVARYRTHLAGVVGEDAALHGSSFDFDLGDEPFRWSPGREDVEQIVLLNRTLAPDVLPAARNVRLVQKLGLASLGFDVHAAKQRNVRVCWLSDPCYRAVAEHTLMLMLAAARDLIVLDSKVRRGESRDAPPMRTSQNERLFNWMGLSGDRFRPLAGARLGVVGLGEIATEVVRRARAFDMKILYTKRSRLDPGAEAALGVQFAPLADLLAASDFVTVHVTHFNDRPLLGQNELALMRPDSYLVNTSRGNVIDQSSVFERLRAGLLAGAALDVFSVEPLDPAEVRDVPNLTLSPHVGALIPAGSRFDVVLDNMRAFRTAAPLTGEK